MPSCDARPYSTTGQQHSPFLQCAELQEAFLSNMYIRTNPNVLLRLMQSCKELRTEVPRHCAGKMTATVRAHNPEHAAAFASWLQRHAGLLQGLKLLLPLKLVVDSGLGAAMEALAGAMFDQQQHMQGLQRFTLKSGTWAAGILQILPTSLKKLTLEIPCDNAAAPERLYSLAPIARLQQLKELCLGRVCAAQLVAVQLPPLLQHLDVTVELGSHCSSLLNLAVWLPQHGHTIRHLGLSGMSTRVAGMDSDTSQWAAAMAVVAQRLMCAAPPPAAAAAAADRAGQHTAHSTVQATVDATATPLQNAGTPPPSSWKMQMLRCSIQCRLPGTGVRAVTLPGPLLQQLPAATLTRLECSLVFDEPQHLAALCRLTALHNLEVLPLTAAGAEAADPGLVNCSSDVLSPMSALQQMTALKLGRVSVQQLAHLQLPQLQRLVAFICRRAPGELAGQQQQQQHGNLVAPMQPLQLEHLASLVYLECRGSIMLASDDLPTSLQAVKWTYDRDYNSKTGACSVQPLLKLALLKRLDMSFNNTPPPLATEMRQLTSLQHLKAVSYEHHHVAATVVAGVEPAWAALHLTRLELSGPATESDKPCILLPAAAVHALSGMTMLQTLTLSYGKHTKAFDGKCVLVEATFAELAAALQPLTALQRLTLKNLGLLDDMPLDQHMTTHLAIAGKMAGKSKPVKPQPKKQKLETSYEEERATWLQELPAACYHSASGVLALSSAICSLPRLEALQLQLPVRLEPAAMRPKALQQLEQQLQRFHVNMKHSLADSGHGLVVTVSGR